MYRKQYNDPVDQKEEQMPEYIVFAMPPAGGDAEPFDIPEWGYIEATATAERYHAHGWGACIIDFGTPSVPWRAKRLDGPDIRVMARTRDEACIRACAVSHGCIGFERMEG